MEESIKLFISAQSDVAQLEVITQHLKAQFKLKAEVFNYHEAVDLRTSELVFLFLSDDEIKKFIKKTAEQKPLVGILQTKIVQE